VTRLHVARYRWLRRGLPWRVRWNAVLPKLGGCYPHGSVFTSMYTTCKPGGRCATPDSGAQSPCTDDQEFGALACDAGVAKRGCCDCDLEPYRRKHSRQERKRIKGRFDLKNRTGREVGKGFWSMETGVGYGTEIAEVAFLMLRTHVRLTCGRGVFASAVGRELRGFASELSCDHPQCTRRPVRRRPCRRLGWQLGCLADAVQVAADFSIICVPLRVSGSLSTASSRIRPWRVARLTVRSGTSPFTFVLALNILEPRVRGCGG
jgi:hypothetical protein